MNIHLSTCERHGDSTFIIDMDKVKEHDVCIIIDWFSPNIKIEFKGVKLNEAPFLNHSFTLKANPSQKYKTIQIDYIYHIELVDVNCEFIYMSNGTVRVRHSFDGDVGTIISYGSSFGEMKNKLPISNGKPLKYGVIRYGEHYYFVKTNTLVSIVSGICQIPDDNTKQEIIGEIKSNIGTMVMGVI